MLALGIDSVYFTDTYFDGRQITNVLVVLYFLAMYATSNSHLRKLMFVMVLLSYIGELLFCTLLGMYTYRTPYIPLYVPFGHGIVYASGYIIAKTTYAAHLDNKLRVFFAIAFTLLFLYAGFFLGDILTLILGLLFFLLLYRKRWDNMYYFIALCVILIELIGTYYKCWGWGAKIFGQIPASNPPMGAVFLYAGGDVLLAKIVALWNRRSAVSKSQ
ncbi:multisubunit Na+/H+ antiporter MnhE subunit [Pedobacter sp. UYP24]